MVVERGELINRVYEYMTPTSTPTRSRSSSAGCACKIGAEMIETVRGRGYRLTAGTTDQAVTIGAISDGRGGSHVAQPVGADMK